MALADWEYEAGKGSQGATYRQEAAILAWWFPGPVIPDKINHRQPSHGGLVGWWLVAGGPTTVTITLLGLAKLNHQLWTFFLWLVTSQSHNKEVNGLQT